MEPRVARNRRRRERLARKWEAAACVASCPERPRLGSEGRTRSAMIVTRMGEDGACGLRERVFDTRVEPVRRRRKVPPSRPKHAKPLECVIKALQQ